MKSIKVRLTTLLTIAMFLGAVATGRSQRIDLVGVPLIDSIKTLATQMEINFIFDPKLSELAKGADGKIVLQSTVTYHWENKSAEEALAQLLKEHGLKMMQSPASSVTRIASTNQVEIKVQEDLPGNDNTAIPLMVMDGTPLPEALKTLARSAKIEIALDEKLSRSVREASFRWKNLTAKQALTALCENFDLAVVKNPSGVVQIKSNEN